MQGPAAAWNPVPLAWNEVTCRVQGNGKRCCCHNGPLYADSNKGEAAKDSKTSFDPLTCKFGLQVLRLMVVRHMQALL